MVFARRWPRHVGLRPPCVATPRGGLVDKSNSAIIGKSHSDGAVGESNDV